MSNIIRVKVVFNHILEITFDDKKRVNIDFYRFISQSNNPLINQYTDKIRFQREWTLDNGVLTWNNDMDFDPDELYKLTVKWNSGAIITL